MKRAWPAAQAAVSLAVWPLAIVLSPLILVAGEPVNRYVMRRVRVSAAAGPAAVTGHGGPVTGVVPGSVKGLHLVVEDMAATRAALTERGVELTMSRTWAASCIRISALPTATCGRYSSGLLVTRHSQGALARQRVNAKAVVLAPANNAVAAAP
ncbi:MAG TPA: hypothetical protein VF838_14090 [Trebonia sp.]